MTMPNHENTIEVSQADMERGQREHEYSLLLAAYRSDQITEAQWQQHLEDQDFADWYRSL